MAQAPDQVSINVDIEAPPEFDIVTDVGTVYEVAINGVGYMLADHPEKGIEYDRNTVGLDPERLATSETPFSQAIERYTFTSLDDFAGGAGQKWRNRGESDAKRFDQSDGVNPFLDEGYASLLHDVEELKGDDVNSGLMVVVAGDNIYLLTDDDEITYSDDGGVTWTGATPTNTFTIAAATTITGLASDGESWYAAAGAAGIFKGTTSDPGAAWSAEKAAEVQWAAGRLFATVYDGTSTTPNEIITLGNDGLEDYSLDILPEGHTIIPGGVAGGFYFYASYAGARGSVYAWQLGLDEGSNQYEPFVAWDLPDGMIPSAIGTAGGSVWVRAYQPEGSSVGQASIYRLIVEGGQFIPFFLCDVETQGTAVDQSIGAFGSYLDQVWFSWPSMEPTGSGLGAVNLKTGGWAESFVADELGDVRSIAVHQGRVLFTVWDGVNSHLYAQDLDVYVDTGNLTMSIVDAGSALDKVFDEVTVVCDPIATGESILVQYSTDQGSTWQSLGTVDTVDATNQTFALNTKAPTLQLRAVLYGDTTTTPKLALVQVRYHALGLADTILVLPVDCTDRRTGINGAPLPGNAVYAGIKAARKLEGLVQTRCQIQDIDWHVTESVDTYEMLQAQAKVVSLRDASTGQKNMRTIMTLTMRKVGTA